MKNDHPISQEEFERVERYLSEEMPPAEYEAFAAELARNITLQQKVNDTRLLLLGIKEAALVRRLDVFQKELDYPLQVETQKRRPVIAKYWWAAASLLVIVAITFFLIVGKDKNERLFAAYFEADPGLVTAMGASDEYEFNRAMIDYKTGNYKPALEVWKKLLIARPGNDTLQYFAGVAFLASGRADSAVLFLEKVAAKDESAFQSDACWYLGLSLLKQGEKEKAIPFFRRTDYFQKEEILSKLQ